MKFKRDLLSFGLIGMVLFTCLTANAQVENLIGKWHGYYGNHNYKWSLRIDSVKANRIYGIGRNVLHKKDFTLKGVYMVEDGIYEVTFKKQELESKKKPNLVGASFDLNTNKGIYDEVAITKTINDKPNLLKGLKGRWIGSISNSNSHFDATFTKITKDSIYGFLVDNEENNFFKGLYQVRNDSWWDTNIAISMYDDNRNEMHLRYMDKKLDGIIINGVDKRKVKINAKKSAKVPQSLEKIKQVDFRLTELEKKVQNLNYLFYDITRFGEYTPISTIQKARNLLLELDKFQKENPIPEDNLLTIKQEERYRKIKHFIMFKATDTKIVKALNLRN